MAFSTWEVLVVVVVILMTILLWRRNPRNMPPGPRGWPIVGSLFSLSQDEPFVDMWKLGKKYGGRGDLVTLQLGNATVVVLNNYESVKTALVKKGEFFNDRPDKGFFREFGRNKGIMSAPYSEAWKEQRTFTMKTLRSFGMGKRSLEGKISEEIGFVFDKIDKYNGQAFDIQQTLFSGISNTIYSIIKGERFDYEDPQFKHLLQALQNMMECVGSVAPFAFFPILTHIPVVNKNFKVLRKTINSFSNYFLPLIEKHKSEFQEYDVKDFIDAYLLQIEKTKHDPASSFQDKEQLTVVLGDLFTAGSETTSASIYWLILNLAINADIQKQVHQEIDRVVGRERLPTLEDESKLPYTRAVIRETLRLVPVGPLAAPHSTTEDAQLMGYDIPKGTLIFTNIWAIQHDPNTWDEPFSFRPSRFIDASGNLKVPDEYIPFNIGRRGCPGEQLATMQLYLYTTSLFHRYSFKLPEGAPTPSLKGNNGLTYTALPYKIVAEKRGKL